MTKETEVQVATPTAMVTRDREDPVIVEDVVIDPPEIVEKDYEDIIIDSDDPRGAIYAQHNKKREKDIEVSKAQFAPENTEIGDGNPELGVETDETGAIIEPSPQVATPPDAAEMVEVKVGGVTRSVPKDKVDAQGGIENYQIRLAAQEQMERNAHDAKALAARQAALDDQERRMNATTAAIPAMDSLESQTPDRSTPPDGQKLEANARRYQEAVYDDASDAPSIFVQAVQEAVDSAVSAALKQGKPFDEAALRHQVKEDVLFEQRQAKIVKAGQAMINSHPELNMRDTKFDPRMYENIDNETMVVDREHPEWEPEQVVQTAYDRISEWKGNAPPQPKTMSDKQAAKQAMTRPRTGTQRYAPPPEPPKATRADYVAAERKRRGLDM